ncbi:SRPBCC family protein [Nocardioides sp. SYSU D00038]|uniref:SRPBCC family protein n=1 Tax=Nocardioides sp. SYSU D00038 TaxID=2812554 RepID=UPI00196792E3|nr:SRPBCC family protein [Nocardioides sp. SYSU D00038]
MTISPGTTPELGGAVDLGGTTVLTSTVRIDHPAPDVAAYVLDWGHDAEWRSAVVGFTCQPPGPAAVGQRLEEELRFAGMTFRTPSVITHVTALSAAWAGGTDRVRAHGERSVRPLGERSCEVELTTTLSFAGAMRLLAPVLRPSYRRADAADAAGLAAHVDRFVANGGGR